jgi:hypothetical protein
MSVYSGPEVVNDGLVLSFDAASLKSYSGSGNVWYDISVNNSSATLNNSPSFSGSNNGYLQFNGTNQNGNLVTPSLIPTGNLISIGVWCYGIVSKAQTLLFGINASGSRTINLHLPYSSNIAYWDAGGTTVYDRIAVSVDTGYQGWHYWAATKNATSGVMNLYKDGVLIATGTGKTIPLDTTTQVNICSYNNQVDYHQGYISKIEIYNKELTAEEIRNNFNAHRGRFNI